MKIYVAGNCQSVPLAACVAAMNPRVNVERLDVNVDPLAIASDGDLIFRQRNPRVAWTRRPPRHNEILYPRVWFNAFHPDLVYVAHTPAAVAPPMGMCHSSLVLYGWHRALSVAQTAKLFCDPVFERLSFFRSWDAAKRALLEEGECVGFPLGALFDGWARSGAFMHSCAHPALSVVADIARGLARRAELSVALDAPEYYLNDPLLNLGVWPIYPEIADRLGCAGSYAFKAAHPAAWMTTPDIFELDEFIARSFEAYGHMAPDDLACARLNNPAYRDLERVAGAAGTMSSGAAPLAAELERELALEHRDFLAPGVPVDPSGRGMDVLDRSSMRAPLEVALPRAVTARTVVTVPCMVKNDGDSSLVSGGKHPVFLSYRWYDARGDLTEVGHSVHTALTSVLEPGAAAELSMEIAAPQYEGRYLLAVALLQSEIAWFDDVDPANGVRTVVDVAPKPARSADSNRSVLQRATAPV